MDLNHTDYYLFTSIMKTENIEKYSTECFGSFTGYKLKRLLMRKTKHLSLKKVFITNIIGKMHR